MVHTPIKKTSEKTKQLKYFKNLFVKLFSKMVFKNSKNLNTIKEDTKLDRNMTKNMIRQLW